MADSTMRDALSRSYDALAVRNQVGYKREFNNTNFLRVTVPTIPYEAFDSAGEKVLPLHLQKLFDSGQFTSHLPVDDGPGTGMDTWDGGIVSYLIYHELEIDQSLYKPDSPKFPLLMEYRFLYAGTTSRASIGVLRHPTRVKPYAKVVYVGVRVDPVTRKPLPFPERWKTQYGIPSQTDATAAKTEHLEPRKYPTVKLFRNEQRVAYSDVDANGHANYTFYTRVSYDSFAENLFAGRLGKQAVIHFQNGVKKIQITFSKECLMGDTMTVLSWVDEHSSERYYFEITTNGALCARLTMTFHEQSATESDSKL